MTISEYLAELERLLPRTHRRRFLAEAEEHLEDEARANRARGLGVEAAEQAAVESFGDPAVIARRLAPLSASTAVRRGSLVALGAIVTLVLPLYGIPENTLPPARWDSKPTDIAILQGVSIALWLGAVALGVLGVALSLTRYARVAATALAGACAAVAAFVAVGMALFARWLDEAPWTPLWPFIALALPISIACLAVCVAAALWVGGRSADLGGVVTD